MRCSALLLRGVTLSVVAVSMAAAGNAGAAEVAVVKPAEVLLGVISSKDSSFDAQWDATEALKALPPDQVLPAVLQRLMPTRNLSWAWGGTPATRRH